VSDFMLENKKQQWLAVIGSPRKGQNTETLVDIIGEVLETKNIEVTKIHLSHKNINTCNACEYCITEGYCHINDDVTEILSLMKTMDGFVFASPSYNYNMTAQMKAVLDRTFSLNDYEGGWSSRVPDGKKAIIAGTCKGTTEDGMGYTVKGMSIGLSELGIDVIDEISYLNTKTREVATDLEIKKILEVRLKDVL